MLFPVGATPPPPHILKYVISLAIKISTKISVISLLARRLVFGEKIEICHPLLGAHHPIL